MIISKTPFRMSFFGGGTDISEFYKEYGGNVLSTTFDKYCYVNVRYLPRFFDYVNEVVYSEIERVDSNLDEMKHPLIRNCMKHLGIQGIHLSYEADLPARSGLGTSSSFAVGMLNCFHVLKGECVDKRKLVEEAIYVERVLCNEAGGIQDQIAASYGGLNRIDMTAEGYVVNPVTVPDERKKQLNDNLMLFFTGFSRFSSNIQETMSVCIKDKTKELLEMKKIVHEAEKILTSKADLSEFGRLLDYSWKLKREVNCVVSTDVIDEIYMKAKSVGAIGGKLLGAGGGGFLLFYVERDMQDRVKQALQDYLYVPFKFENDGTKIIHYAAEEYNLVEGR